MPADPEQTTLAGPLDVLGLDPEHLLSEGLLEGLGDLVAVLLLAEELVDPTLQRLAVHLAGLLGTEHVLVLCLGFPQTAVELGELVLLGTGADSERSPTEEVLVAQEPIARLRRLLGEDVHVLGLVVLQ